jgi:hypothetical protein
MLRRNRTTKALARRIDLEYFAKPHWFRRWKFILSIGIPLVALVWLFAARAQSGQKPYSSGPLSHCHAVFTERCSLCHFEQAGKFFRRTDKDACLACHDGPVHHENQRFEPACSSCHVEHTGSLRLTAMADANCVQCHADLHSTSEKSRYETEVTSFENRHPEFRAIRTRSGDPGAIKLNHYVHLAPNLIGPDQRRVQMACEDCHEAASENVPAPYSGTAAQLKHAADLKFVAPSQDRPVGRSQALRMAPPEFARHCAGCHLLTFDQRFGEEMVPHDNPETIHKFLVQRFTEYIQAHPSSVHEIDKRDRELPERPNAVKLARDSKQWVDFRVEDAEWLLYRKTCKQCHVLKTASGSLPEIAKPQIARSWFQNANFDHHSHREIACSSCHVKAVNSRETSDVLIADIATCRHCHGDGGAAKQAAEGRCFECHTYHDWSKAKRPRGTYTIPQLRGGAAIQMSLP